MYARIPRLKKRVCAKVISWCQLITCSIKILLNYKSALQNANEKIKMIVRRDGELKVFEFKVTEHILKTIFAYLFKYFSNWPAIMFFPTFTNFITFIVGSKFI